MSQSYARMTYLIGIRAFSILTSFLAIAFSIVLVWLLEFFFEECDWPEGITLIISYRKSINHPFIYRPCHIYSSFHLPSCHIYIHHSYSCNTAFIHSGRVCIFSSRLFNATNVFLQEMRISVHQQKWNVSTEHLVRSAPKKNLLVITSLIYLTLHATRFNSILIM